MDAPATPTLVCRICGVTYVPRAGDTGDRRCPVCLLQTAGAHGGGEAPPAIPATEILGAPAAPRGAAPRRFAHYELAAQGNGGELPIELGHGAMGVTYLARDTVLDRPVALKVIDARVSAAHPEARARFLREAKAAASLRHPNVASIFHYGEQDGECFYAMELVEGETLEARVRRDGPLPAGAALEVAVQVARALVAAGARGIVHRDLKPANLMIATGEEGGDGDELLIKVIDFGLAKAAAAAGPAGGVGANLTQGGFVGTPAYASPEQFAAAPEAERIDGRADIYSLGVTLWYLLTGKVPFVGHNLAEIYDRQIHRPLPLEQLIEARVPAPVVALLRGMLAVDPTGRPASALVLAGELRRCREQLGAGRGGLAAARGGRRGSHARRRGQVVRVAGALALLALLAAAAALLTLGWNQRRPAAPGPPPLSAVSVKPDNVIPEKSVAVLPFDNLSADKANTYFADGVQEEILTNLSHVAELKVISRTSVLQYKDAAKRGNLREIAAALGVTHIVEGSVRRDGTKVRVTAELIDARTDAQLWAEPYDRELSDVFAIQSEIAKHIVTNLRAKLTPGEKAAIDARPTEDLAAYDLYLRAKELVAGFQETSDWRETLLRAVLLLDEATRRDGQFALAWCLTAKAHDQLYFTGLDASPQRLAQQESAVNTALRLQPNLGEAHLARARLLYRGRQDYDGARRELAIARLALPNNAEVFSLTCYLDRRVGRWPEALSNQEKAYELDPNNPSVLNDQTLIYEMLRRYGEEIRTADAAMVVVPASKNFYRLVKASALLAAGQTSAARVELDALPPGFDPDGGKTYTRVCAALYDGGVGEAAEALVAFRGAEFTGLVGLPTPRAWLEALVARAAGNHADAQAALRRARESVEAAVRQRPEDPAALALLGLIEAGLGRKEEAIRAGKRAVEMRPVSADAMDGPGLETALALVCTWTGEPDEAMRHLLVLAKTPGGPDFGQLRNDPAWAMLRERADFQAMLAQLDPHLVP